MIYNVSFTLRNRRQLGQFVRLVITRGPGGTKGPSPVEVIVRSPDGREHKVPRSTVEVYHDPNTPREYKGALYTGEPMLVARGKKK